MRASRAALNFADIASPGSWNVGWVGALEDFGGGGGVGKERDTGRGLLCGITTSFFSPLSPLSLVLLLETTRLDVGDALDPLVCLTLPVLLRPFAGLGVFAEQICRQAVTASAPANDGCTAAVRCVG